MSVIVAYLMLLASCFAIAFRAALPPRGLRWRLLVDVKLARMRGADLVTEPPRKQ
jgi:hypothetical protein